MKLAVNYSPQAAALLAEGKAAFDLYKCPDWDDLVAEVQQAYPVYVHFSLHAGRGSIESADWHKIERLLATTDTHYVNVHLSPDGALYPGLELDTTDPVWQARLVDDVLTDVALVTERFGAENVILENVPWDPDYNIPRPLILPEIITHIVHETGCGLLLDVAHAWIAALYLEMAGTAYLDALPVRHLKEVHITGTKYDPDVPMWRDHFKMTPADWTITKHLFDQIAAGNYAMPEIFALEYGGVGQMFEWRSEKAILAEELPRLHELVTQVRLPDGV